MISHNSVVYLNKSTIRSQTGQLLDLCGQDSRISGEWLQQQCAFRRFYCKPVSSYQALFTLTVQGLFVLIVQFIDGPKLSATSSLLMSRDDAACISKWMTLQTVRHVFAKWSMNNRKIQANRSEIVNSSSIQTFYSLSNSQSCPYLVVFNAQDRFAKNANYCRLRP